MVFGVEDLWNLCREYFSQSYFKENFKVQFQQNLFSTEIPVLV